MLSKLLPYYRKMVPLQLREPISRAINWPEGGQVSYSAHGEDLFVRAWLDEHGVERTSIRYLDIGGNHPSILSNTYLFYRMGGSGVVVEPTPYEAGLLSQQRPKDELVRAGISFDERRSAQLYLFSPSVYNTFDPQEAEHTFLKITELGLPIRREGAIEVPLIPVMDLVSDHFSSQTCHFFSIDVEGVDSLILRCVDWSTFRPWVVCCERPQTDVVNLLIEAGYSVSCQVPHNTIFTLDEIFAASKSAPHYNEPDA